MNRDRADGADLVNAVSRRFHDLVRSLVRGNVLRARSLAGRIREDARTSGEQIAVQNLIEDLAQGQAVRNAFINLPSVVPGIGTILSWVLLSVEDFYTLDQGITLILALSILHGLDPGNLQVMDELALNIIGEAYGLRLPGTDPDSQEVARGFMTRMLPGKYMNRGVKRWSRVIARRILPLRGKSRLLPAGFGIAMSAWNAYSTVVQIGRITQRELSAMQRRAAVR
ncbi:MAG TPA: hypothetical protein PLP82_02340 [Deltaproteobacteria bacterium]|jgi:hypothetical protein|nr:hypothetical protein [Deltaproteobacteria bacterium]HRW79497.1 hypothetical protein [Desulfomonilia bacterium]HNQ85278.1 hypothetical protein [Deltaproteobacteria bacterium]HNS89551.1 hypothetical protein [Deltaproteobacteria bacterium]HOA44357.1 hypothetical protein [Deltaproteobacteria bacterium]